MRSCKSALSSVYRLLFVLFLIGTPLLSKAQADQGCSGQDVYDGNCPLDTWVIVLVVIAGLFTAIYLHRKQKSLQA
jgi:hypothetical protein